MNTAFFAITSRHTIRTVFVLSLLFFCGMYTTAFGASGTWEQVGIPGFSNGRAENISLAFHPTTHEPYVAFEDKDNDERLTIMRFDGSNWVIEGTINDTVGGSLQLVFHPTTGQPYIAYQNSANGNKASVITLSGTQWEYVGTAGNGLSAGQASYISLGFDPTNYQPYLAYRDESVGGKATVKKYNGTSWASVGSTGLTAGVANYTSLAFHPTTKEPYLAYLDGDNGSKTVNVYTYNGSSWAHVNSLYNDDTKTDLSLAFHPGSSEPYIAYQGYSAANSTKGYVVMYNALTNSILQSAKFTNGSAAQVSGLAFQPTSNLPYLAFGSAQSEGNPEKLNVIRHQNSILEYVGLTGESFDSSTDQYVSLAFHPATLEPYVAYQDNTNTSRISVKKYDPFGQIKVTFEEEDASEGETDDRDQKLKFIHADSAAYFMYDTNPRFSGKQWLPIKKSKAIKLKDKDDTQKFFVKFKTLTGNESKVFRESVTYKEKRQIKNSKSKVSRGEILTQSGSDFRKNSRVALYFSKPGGGYYSPQIVTTDDHGKFKVTYRVNKPNGKYKWHAIELSNRRKSESVSYTVR